MADIQKTQKEHAEMLIAIKAIRDGWVHDGFKDDEWVKYLDEIIDDVEGK